jgi:hypothetical protein
MNINLQLDALRSAYRVGNITPRQLLLGLRDKAAALNPDYHLFIHLLSDEELEPYLADHGGVPGVYLCAAAFGDHRRAVAGAGRDSAGQDQS